MLTSNRLIFIKFALLVSIVLPGFAYLNTSKTLNLLSTMLDLQATNHLKTLANGSINDLLTKDYGDLEQWVASAAEGEEYAFAYILSPHGMILLHSELNLASRKIAPVNTNKLIYRKIQYKGSAVIEIISPILIEGKQLGTAHLAYYPEYKHAMTQQYIKNSLSWYCLFYLLLLCGSYLILRFWTKISH